MKKRFLAVIIAGVLSAMALAGCGDEAAEVKETSEVEVKADTDDAKDESEGVADETESSDTEGIDYVDGFYATDADGNDFMIAFYEGSCGDVAYVNDGSDEAVAEYVVEKAQLDDGTEYFLVTVGATQLGYYEEGDDIYLIDDEGTIYGAARLSEEEADALYTAVTE